MKKQTEKPNKEMELEKAKPEKLPDITYWPFFLAMGISFLVWGIIVGWIISITGIIIIIISLIGWINILRNEARRNRN